MAPRLLNQVQHRSVAFKLTDKSPTAPHPNDGRRTCLPTRLYDAKPIDVLHEPTVCTTARFNPRVVERTSQQI